MRRISRIDKIELASPMAIAGVLCANFFTHWLKQQPFQATMGTTPVVAAKQSSFAANVTRTSPTDVMMERSFVEVLGEPVAFKDVRRVRGEAVGNTGHAVRWPSTPPPSTSFATIGSSRKQFYSSGPQQPSNDGNEQL